MRRLTLALALALLVAVGAPSPAVASPTPPSPIWVFGDSLVWGVGSTVPAVRSWPARLGTRIAGETASGQQVVNKGVGGITMWVTRADLHEPLETWAPALVAASSTKPAEVIVAVGVNDLGAIGIERIPDLALAFVRAYHRFRSAGVERIRIATISPIGAGVAPGSVFPSGWVAAIQGRRGALNDALRSLFIGTGELLDIGDSVAGADGLLKPVYDSGDGLHLSDLGYVTLSDAVDLSRL